MSERSGATWNRTGLLRRAEGSQWKAIRMYVPERRPKSKGLSSKFSPSPSCYSTIHLTQNSIFQCSYADCVNYSPNQEPFYLHPPSISATSSNKNKIVNTNKANGNSKTVICTSSHTTNPKIINKVTNGNVSNKVDNHNKCNGFYINPINSVLSTENHSRNPNDSFYLHNPREVIYTRIQDVFNINETRMRRVSNDSTISSGSSTLAAKSNSSNGLTGNLLS